MATNEHTTEIDALLAASSLGADGMAELCARIPVESVAAIRHSATARATVEDFADALDQVSPLARLQVREALEELVRTINDNNSARKIRALARDLAHNRTLGRDLVLVLARVRDLARDRALALALARDLARAHARDLDRARDLARDLQDLEFACSGGDSRFEGTERSCTAALLRADSLLAGAVRRVFDHLPVVLDDLDAHTRLINVLRKARDEFLNADLTDADLAGAWLEGVKWTRATRWPPDWEDRIQHHSEEIFPDIWQIRSGNLREEVSV